jgi:phage portal protein BeeE
MHIRRLNLRQDMLIGKLWGFSKLHAGKRLLDKSLASIEAEATFMQNQGARTIIFPKGGVYDVNDDTAGEQSRQAVDMARRKLMQVGAGGVAGFPFELGSIQLGVSPSDMNFLESDKATMNTLCAMWHVHPMSVFPDGDTSSLGGNKEEEANKQTLRAGVLPDLRLFYNKLNNFVAPGYSKAKQARFIDYDTSVYPELQDDKGAMMAWVEKLILSPNQRNEFFGIEPSTAPGMDTPIVPTNYAPITDFVGADGSPRQTNPESVEEGDKEGENDGSY